MHPARHADAAESFAPSDGIRLVAELGGQRVRHLGAPTHIAVNLFLNVDKRWFHDAVSISPLPAPRKPERGNQTAAAPLVLPEVLTPGIVLNALETAAK